MVQKIEKSRTLGRKRAASLLDDSGQDDLTDLVALADASAPSTVSARSRVGAGMCPSHVAPLDAESK